MPTVSGFQAAHCGSRPQHSAADGDNKGRTMTMRSAWVSWLVGLLAIVGSQTSAVAAQEMTLATTTSTEDTGLLAAILPDFEQAHDVKVKVVAVGTGQALKLARDGNADVLLVHARQQEDQFIAEGFGKDRRDVMFNDFVVVGPADDPASIRGSKSTANAFAAIAARKVAFASRGDESGTHSREKAIWEQARIAPAGDWYLSIGQGMGSTLTFANEKKAYTLSDRGTYLSMKERLPALTILFGGTRISENPDSALLNPYGVIAVNPEKHSHVKYDLALQFIRWITSPEVQKRIGAFGVEKYGQPLFHPWGTKGE
jgi:tungstate transport system substrate-binding protein